MECLMVPTARPVAESPLQERRQLLDRALARFVIMFIHYHSRDLVCTQNPHPLSQVYSFVPIPGAQQHKRPRRRYEEIERMYKCGWQGCEKAYGTLNHLNAHVTMQSHGQKRTPEGQLLRFDCDCRKVAFLVRSSTPALGLLVRLHNMSLVHWLWHYEPPSGR